jgi:putative transposase
MESNAEKFALLRLSAFKDRGLPRAIRSDNGVPSSPKGLFNLSGLSVWWLRLGIILQ